MLLAAPQVLPTLELAGEAQRVAVNDPPFVTSFSLPPENLLTFVAPAVLGDVEAAAPGLLVTSDGWASGWQATVDGSPAEIHRANHAFRAVLVPSGRHQVAFAYRPLPARVGRVLTPVALVLAAAGLCWGRMRHPRPAS